MKFICFVEGQTEEKVLPDFLKGWLDPKLSKPVGISTVRSGGWAEQVNDLPKKARLYSEHHNVIAVMSLLDLYGPTFYPDEVADVSERHERWKRHLEKSVDHEKFFQFFAVHELEAWLFSQPSIFPSAVKADIEGKSHDPESINDTQPPAKLLKAIYRQRIRGNYDKIVDGTALFKKLDPEIAYQKCPHLKLLLDKMLELAKSAGH